jgi:hypothetical protein
LNNYPEKVDKLYLISPGGMNEFKGDHKEDIMKKVQKMNWFKRLLVKYHLKKTFEHKVYAYKSITLRILLLKHFILNFWEKKF